MPRDPSGVYTQPFPFVIDNTPIETAVYNGFTSDVVTDLNTPRPVVAGGTGANNAHDAMLAMGGEIAKQVVDNYGGFPFANGSFYSAPGATGAPTANGFVGTYYENADGSAASLQARDLATGTPYMKMKVAGVWDASWTEQAGGIVDLGGVYVDVLGDTMLGLLGLPAITPLANSAVRKDYVDALAAAVADAAVAVGGDTMTGFLTLHAAPDADMKAANKKYVDDAIAAPVAPPGLIVLVKTNPYTCVLSDANKCLQAPSGAFTIPSNASVPYPVGTCLTFVAWGGACTISIAGGDAMYLAGQATTGVRTLANTGVCTAVKQASAAWSISGPGLT